LSNINDPKGETSITIRPYAPADRDGVNRVALAAFAQYESHYEDWVSFREGIARTADLAGDADLIVADGGGVSGVGGLIGAVAHVGPGKRRNQIFPDDWSIIRMLVVEPEQRGRGIARRLVAAALQRARDGAAPFIGLHTSPIMADALSLYVKLGFERDCELAPIRGVPYSRYVMAQAAIPAALERLGAL
jgi:GNAT superfamily N-acetyltransferase